MIATTPKQLQHFFDRQIERELQGIVAKRLDAPYEAGARNFNWIKLKQPYRGELSESVDAVNVEYLRGRGMRAKLGIGAVLVAVYRRAIKLSRKTARVRSRIIADV